MTKELETLEAEITKTQAEIANTHGTPCEVYARIVGYYRAVQNWNKGKSAEEKQRKMFDVSNLDGLQKAHFGNNAECAECKIAKPTLQSVAQTLQEHFRAEVYTVGDFGSDLLRAMQDTPIKMQARNITTKENQEAMFASGVEQVPCVAFFYDNELLATANNGAELKAIFAQCK